VVRALDEAVRLKLRLRLLDHDMTELTPEFVEQLRSPRISADEPGSTAQPADAPRA
jgi:hypothetical protein